MNVKEWLNNFEFQDLWDCMQANWPTAKGLEEQYRDLFAVLRNVHITAKQGDKVIYLGFNNEGEIDNRLQGRYFYEPIKDLYTTDVWDFASLTVSRNTQDEAIGKLTDVEFAAALLRYAGDALLTAVPYQVPELVNPFDANTNRLKGTRLARTSKSISDNWKLWYSICRGVTFSNKRRAMEFKEYFLHSRNLMKYEVEVNHSFTSEVVAAIEEIEDWLKGQSIERLMIFVYVHPQNRHQAQLWTLLSEDRFPFCESKIITDDAMHEDATRLLLFADFSKVKDNDDAFTKDRYGTILFCPEGIFEFIDADKFSDCEDSPTFEPDLKVWGKKGDTGEYLIHGKMTDIMDFCKKVQKSSLRT